MKIFSVFVSVNLIVLIASCTSSYQEDTQAEIIIKVDPSIAIPVTLENLLDTAFALPVILPDSVYIGVIEQLDVMNDGRILIMDPYIAERIILLNADGTYFSQLNQIGAGPGEFQNLFNFAINPSEDQVAVFDRMSRSFHVYNLPRFKYIESYRYSNYIMHMQWIEDDLMYIMNEDLDVNDHTLGLELFDWSRKQLKNSFLRNDRINAIELSFANTFSRMGSKNYFAYHSPISTIFELHPKGIQPRVSIDFGKAAPDLGFFTGKDMDDPEGYLSEFFKATWIRNFTISENRLSFQHIYKEPDNQHLVFANLETGELKNYQNPSWSALNSGEMPSPIGRYGDYFIYSINFEELKTDFFNQSDQLSQSLRRSVNISGFDPEQLFLLFVKYKHAY